MQVLAGEDRMGKELSLDLPADSFHPISEGVACLLAASACIGPAADLNQLIRLVRIQKISSQLVRACVRACTCPSMQAHVLVCVVHVVKSWHNARHVHEVPDNAGHMP